MVVGARHFSWFAAVLGSSLTIGGCAMSKPAGPPPASAPAPAQGPSEEQFAPTGEAPKGVAPQGTATAAPFGPSAPDTMLGGAGGDDKAPTFERLFDELTAAEKLAANPGQDCPGACRALRSMQRAAGGICSLAPPPDTSGRCRTAENRYRVAREKVRMACGQCSDGLTLDPNAPVEEER